MAELRHRLMRLSRLHRAVRAPTPWLARFGRAARGNISIEFALVLPFLVLLLMGAYDFGRGFTEKLRLNSAARAGTQYALAHYNAATADLYPGVQQSAWDDADDVNQILQVIPNIYPLCLDGSDPINDKCPNNEVPLRYIEVDVSGPFEFMFDYPMTTGSMTLQGHAELRLR